MTAAGVLHCPSCGGPVAEGTRRCTHCDVPVATVRCADCFHMSAADAIHCAGCGRELGLEPIARDGTLPCPDCHLPMAVMECGPSALHDCGRCGGQFVEHDALRDLVERHDRFEVGGRRPPSLVSVDTRVRYVACPVCHALMNRRSFGAGSGVVVDTCSRHGTWFDPGELPRVLSFVESGGLSRLRRRQNEEREQATRDRVSHAVESARHPSSSFETSNENTLAGASIVADLLVALFG
ncbi:MAG TPA: zf-TFIIB domain-containing protein [Polyangiaceae bacterium]